MAGDQGYGHRVGDAEPGGKVVRWLGIVERGCAGVRLHQNRLDPLPNALPAIEDVLHRVVYPMQMGTGWVPFHVSAEHGMIGPTALGSDRLRHQGGIEGAAGPSSEVAFESPGGCTQP